MVLTPVSTAQATMAHHLSDATSRVNSSNLSGISGASTPNSGGGGSGELGPVWLLSLKAGDREMLTAERAAELLGSARGREDKITKIALGTKSFGRDAARYLGAEVLPKLTALRDADLADIIAGRMEAEGLEALKTICDVMKDIPVTAVDLSDNALGTKGIRACAGLLASLETLEQLKLCNDGLSADACGEVADLLLFRGPDAPTRLKTLHFFNNMQDDGGGIHIARVVERSPLLEDFRLSSTRCKNDGGVALGTALGKFHNLRKLEISDNSFGSVGGEALAKAIAGGQPHLTHLDLKDLSFEDEGGIPILKLVSVRELEMELKREN